MKTRPDSLFASLTPEQRETLFAWLLIECISYKSAVERIAKEWGITTSLSALARCYSVHSFAWRVEQAKADAEAQAAALPPDVDAQIKQRLKQRQFELALSQMDANQLATLASLDTEERKLRLKEAIEPAKLALAERRVALLEKAQADARKVMNDTSLTPEEKTARYHQILGMV